MYIFTIFFILNINKNKNLNKNNSIVYLYYDQNAIISFLYVRKGNHRNFQSY